MRFLIRNKEWEASEKKDWKTLIVAVDQQKQEGYLFPIIVSPEGQCLLLLSNSLWKIILKPTNGQKCAFVVDEIMHTQP